jgi:type I restriction enzyme M protein
MVALPGQLFTNTQIPACIWFLTKNKGERTAASGRKLRDRKGEVLFIDARNLGYMKDRVLRDFTQDDLNKVTETLHSWQMGEGYEDEAGFCASVDLKGIEKHDFVLTPGRYVGAVAEEEDGEEFGEKMERLTGLLKTQFEEGDKLEAEIKRNLAGLGYEV